MARLNSLDPEGPGFGGKATAGVDMQSLGFDEIRVLSQTLNTSDPWQIAGHVRLDFPRFVRTVKRLKRRGLLAVRDGKIRLTPMGKAAARGDGLRSLKAIARRIDKAKIEFTRIMRRRPRSISLYDQGYMTLDSVFSRVETAIRMGDVDSKRIALLGDDDLVSVALCLAADPIGVTVFEIDQRIVDFIVKIASRRRLPVSVECRDLREPLPGKLKGRFHTFISDPSETMSGLKMFIGRGLFLLRQGEGSAGYFGLTTIEASARKWGRLQRWLLSGYEVALTHVLPTNAYYHNWPDILAQTRVFSLDCLSMRPKREWFNSSLIRLETLNGFKPKQGGPVRESIFCDDEACGTIPEDMQ